MPEQWTPGQRNKKLRPGHINENTAARLHFSSGLVILFATPNEELDSEDIVLHLASGRLKFNMALTSLTEQELAALREIFTLAFDWAEPIVKKRDADAEYAFQHGDDSFTRVYRQVPNLVIRKRPGGEHSESLQDRPDGVSESNGGSDDPTLGVRGTGVELAGDDQDTSQSEDDDAEDHEP